MRSVDVASAHASHWESASPLGRGQPTWMHQCFSTRNGARSKRRNRTVSADAHDSISSAVMLQLNCTQQAALCPQPQIAPTSVLSAKQGALVHMNLLKVSANQYVSHRSAG